ncbi:MAG: hypothetical protein MZV49_11570 [Rhodopseudomonas palustris]|nr:hypothetical protein [Rhodopseudomonas palustris]
MLIGAAMASTLYDPAFAALARLFGAGARRPITYVTLAGGGFASTAGLAGDPVAAATSRLAKRLSGVSPRCCCWWWRRCAPLALPRHPAPPPPALAGAHPAAARRRCRRRSSRRAGHSG